MRSGLLAAVVAALGACFLLGAPADAQTTPTTTVKKRTPVAGYGHTVVVIHGEDGRTRTRIIVQKRSYLDAGTEVLPGERKYTDYAYPPTYQTFSVLPGSANPAGFQNPKWPLPGPWEFNRGFTIP
jgi:hypothetical protein